MCPLFYSGSFSSIINCCWITNHKYIRNISQIQNDSMNLLFYCTFSLKGTLNKVNTQILIRQYKMIRFVFPPPPNFFLTGILKNRMWFYRY